VKKEKVERSENDDEKSSLVKNKNIDPRPKQ